MKYSLAVLEFLVQRGFFQTVAHAHAPRAEAGAAGGGGDVIISRAVLAAFTLSLFAGVAALGAFDFLSGAPAPPGGTPAVAVLRQDDGLRFDEDCFRPYLSAIMAENAFGPY